MIHECVIVRHMYGRLFDSKHIISDPDRSVSSMHGAAWFSSSIPYSKSGWLKVTVMKHFSTYLDLEKLWSMTYGDPRVCVAILDGPVDRSHESLRHAAITLLNPQPVVGGIASLHGTYIASIIFGQHNGLIPGIAPRCRGLAIPIFMDDVTGDIPACSQKDLAKAIDVAVQAGAHIINISAGEMSHFPPTDPLLESAVRNCVTSGVLVVAAAGNQGGSQMQVPSTLPSVLAVGAMNEQGDPLESSSWIVGCESCGLLAPGAAILGARIGGGTRVDSGTSCATATVSGIAALLMSLQLNYDHKLDPYMIREVLINSALKKRGDSDRVLNGRINVRGAVMLLKEKLGHPPREHTSSISVPEPPMPVPSPFGRYAITAQALNDRYGNVSQKNFGTIDVTIPDRRVYNVRDLHYWFDRDNFGMRFVPVSDEDNAATSAGSGRHGYDAIDNLLRREMGLNRGDPIYAYLSYIRPEEHVSDLFRLADTQKLQLGHQHLGTYLGEGRTSHALPRKRDWKGEGPLNMKWNVDRYPANVHIISLHGVQQALINRNAHIVNSILTSRAKSPANPQTLQCRTTDINTTLQFYRDSIRGADYLEDISWFTNCAVHTTIVVNVLLNVPHNERSFQEIFGDDGLHLWMDFKRRYEEIHGKKFEAEDETHFEPLWKLSGLRPEAIKPLTFAEYNSFRVAKVEGWLEEYSGRTPIDSQIGLAWPLETALDVVSRFLEVYVSVRDAGAITTAAVLLFLRHKATRMLLLDEESYLHLVKPMVTKLILAAASEGADDPTWLQNVKRRLFSLINHAEIECRGNQELGAVLERTIDECVKSAACELTEVCGARTDKPMAAGDVSKDSFVPELVRLRKLATSGEAGAGYFSTPSIIHQISNGIHPSSPFVRIRSICTVMDQSELVPCSSSDLSGIEYPAFKGSQATREMAANWNLLNLKEESMNMSDVKITFDGKLDKDVLFPSQSDSSTAISPSTDGIEPATRECGCNSTVSSNNSALVYALGQIGYDFISESRRNSIKQKMEGTAGPDDTIALLNYLDANPHDASAVQWILKLDGAPVYEINPLGPFAQAAFELLRQFLKEQIEEKIERVCIPGVVSGSSVLRSGIVIAAVAPEVRGMYSWTTDALVRALSDTLDKRKTEGEGTDFTREAVRNFLNRVYYQIRNLGRTPPERAVNYAATNAFEVARVFESALQEQMELDTVEVERSPICAPGTDSWDVNLTFFYPQRQVQTVRKVFRFAVDVADVVPSTVGPMRSWFVR